MIWALILVNWRTLTFFSGVSPSFEILNCFLLNEIHMFAKVGDVQANLEHLLLLKKLLKMYQIYAVIVFAENLIIVKNGCHYTLAGR